MLGFNYIYTIIWWLMTYFYDVLREESRSNEKKQNEQKPKKEPKEEKVEDKEVSQLKFEDRVSQEYILSKVSQKYNSLLTRHLSKSCYDLYEYDNKTPLNKKRINLPGNKWFNCYGCNNKVKVLHPVYNFSCVPCGVLFQKNRYMQRDLTDRVGLVIGARTKLGHQILLKLVRSGAKVIGTTRYPKQALELFKNYVDYEKWSHLIDFYDVPLDLDTPEIKINVNKLCEFIEAKYGRLDILVNCAAQTIRVREKNKNLQSHFIVPNKNLQSHFIVPNKNLESHFIVPNKNLDKDKERQTNRYGDARYVDATLENSWNLKFEDLDQEEIEEVLRINSVAPLIIIQSLIPSLRKSKVLTGPYIINVHAREGLFEVHKTDRHIHTNMAKASLAMLTKCLLSSKLKTDSGIPFNINGCDPGWFSIDEYYENGCPWIIPPLDEIDGAARILYPVFKNLGSCGLTRRHFTQLSY
jgi:NAD(P)-dependent dehydrogenase (short-subunit alcohol dehydrogenase family)